VERRCSAASEMPFRSLSTKVDYLRCYFDEQKMEPQTKEKKIYIKLLAIRKKPLLSFGNMAKL
jgi:hypothetical protein